MTVTQHHCHFERPRLPHAQISRRHRRCRRRCCWGRLASLPVGEEEDTGRLMQSMHTVVERTLTHLHTTQTHSAAGAAVALASLRRTLGPALVRLQPCWAAVQCLMVHSYTCLFMHTPCGCPTLCVRLLSACSPARPRCNVGWHATQIHIHMHVCIDCVRTPIHPKQTHSPART